MAKKTALGLVREALDCGVADQISRNKDGTIMVRRGYFYRMNKSVSEFEESVLFYLHSANVSSKVIDSGDHWAPFRGGSSVARNSHFWVQLEVIV
jgi:hypothetical protein